MALIDPTVKQFAYCSGPAQLVYLSSALDNAGIPYNQVILLPSKGSAPNDFFLSLVSRTAAELGFIVVDHSNLPARPASYFINRYVNRKKQTDYSFWFSRGVSYSPSVVPYLIRSRATKIYEYFDGYRSYIVSRAYKSPFRYRGLRKMVRSVRNRIIESMLAPSRQFFPVSPLWGTTHKLSSDSTTYFSMDIVRSSFMKVGYIIESILGEHIVSAAERQIVLLLGAFSERNPNIDIQDEIRLYHDLLKHLCKQYSKTSIMVKSHPRSSTQKMDNLKILCDKLDVHLQLEQQLVEYMLMRERRKNTVLIGPPSTALLNARTFKLGYPICLGSTLLKSYLGEYELNPEQTDEDQDLMREANVPIIDQISMISDRPEYSQ